MEDIIQIVVFIAFVSIVILRKYQEVNANRPGQSAQQPLPETDFIEEEQDSIEQPETDPKESPVFDFPPEWKSLFDMQELVPKEKDKSKSKKKHTKPCYQPVTASENAEKEHSNNSLKNPAPATIQAAAESPQKTTKAKKEPLIHLKTRSEARKAFIYSEIFNRKYE